MSATVYIDDYLPVVKHQGLNVKNTVVTLPATTTIGGSTVSALGVITSASANALTAGLNGTTGPAFNVDASTSSQADGLNVKGLAAGNGVNVAAITTGTNAPLTLDAAGSGTLTIGGTSTGIVLIGGGSTSQPVINGAITDYDLQTATVTIAALLGGIVTQNSKTGASTITTPTGTQISSGIAGVAVGSTFRTLYYNRGNQTSTITAGASGVTIVGGTAAVTTGKHVDMVFSCTAANTWTLYLTTLY